MNQVITMHGWCSDSTYWKEWEKFFKLEGWLWQNTERGYGSIEASRPLWHKTLNNNPKDKKVVICHSLGIHLISNKLLRQASHIILLNSFSRFIPDGKESRSIRIGLQGMLKHLGKPTEESMLLKFHFKANEPYKNNVIIEEPIGQKISTQGRKLLKIDLNLLINSNNLPSRINKKAKVLIVNGEQDKIVSSSTRELLVKELNNYLKESPLHWSIKDEGHFFRLPGLIKRVINWLETT